MTNQRGSLASAIEDFPTKLRAVVLIGEDGLERVWLDADVETPEQLAWAARHIRSAAVIAEKMDRRAGNA